jgi:hypothetical protein
LSRIRRASALAVLAAGTFLLPNTASADRRIFGYTYPYMTLPKGGFEIEHYLDMGIARTDDPGTPEVEKDYKIDWRHQVEFEFGITDNLDFGFYNVFRQKPYDNFKYSGIKLRSRYRFLDQGRLFVDPAIYVEVGYFEDEVKLEQIIILAKVYKGLEVAVNFKFEEEWKFEDDENEFEFIFIPSAGVGYHITRYLALGVEYYGRMLVEHKKVQYYAQYLGPTVSVAGKHFWWTFTFQPQLTTYTRRPEFQARSLFGIVF